MTIIPLRDRKDRLDGYRLVMNRDELESRPASLPPVTTLRSGIAITYPIDPQSGGTWIATNQYGLSLAVLNMNSSEQGYSRADAKSRGQIIPSLWHHRTADDAAFELMQGEYAAFRPFRLVCADPHLIAEVRFDGRTVSICRQTLGRAPLLFTSSGLGDEKVESHRRRLFTEIIDQERPTSAQQNVFHMCHCARTPELSVLMSRPEARTVSRSEMESNSTGHGIRYFPITREDIAAAADLTTGRFRACA